MMLKELIIQQDAPLNEQDTPTQTYGCRHKSPHTCSNSYMPHTCAFVTEDRICRKPPNTWKRVFLTFHNK